MKKTTLCMVAATLAMTGCMSPLQRAAYDGNTNEVRRLLDAGTDVNTRGGGAAAYAETALMAAAYGGQAETVRLLLERGADVNAKGYYYDFTALIWAAYVGHTDCVRLLLDKGADVNATDSQGWTALTQAAYRGHTECVRLLLERGVNIEARTQGNEYVPSHTALEWAQSRNFPEIVKLIESVARERAAKNAAEEKQRIEKQLKGAPLAQLLEKREFENEAFVAALTEALIRAKNGELPALIVKAAVEQRVALVTMVETRLAQAKAVVVELNGKAEDAVRKNEDAAGYRRQVGKLQVYMAVLTDIKNLLQQS